MKYFSLAILLITILACNKEEEPISTESIETIETVETEDSLTVLASLPRPQNTSADKPDTNLTRWYELKALHDSSYIYQTSRAYGFCCWSKTEIEVEKGIVIRKTSQNGEFGEFDYSNLENEYIVLNENITLYEPSKTYSNIPRTIDELFESCIKNYLTVDTTLNDIHFTGNDIGVFSHCGYTPINCVDECTISLSISGFKWTK